MRQNNEIRFRKAGEVDAHCDVFTAECLKDMASQKPDQFRYDEEEETLYMKIEGVEVI